jgi:hypothetical protein
MNGDRLFTEEELREMGRRTLDVAQEAIEQGNKQKAKELVQRMYEEFNYLHDGAMYWITGLQTYIYQNYGIGAVEQAERFAHTIEGKTVFKPPQQTDLRSLVIQMAKALRGHLQPLVIEEDDEKIVLTMKPCGSGERIVAMGGYEAGFARVKEPHSVTWGMKNFPIYCVHCPVMEMLAFEDTGMLEPVHLVDEPMRHGFCSFAFYKDPANIPEKCYRRIGKEKPAPIDPRINSAKV